MKAKVM